MVLTFARRHKLWPAGREWTVSAELKSFVARLHSAGAAVDEEMVRGIKRVVWALELYSMNLITHVGKLHTMKTLAGDHYNFDTEDTRMEWMRHFCNGSEVTDLAPDVFMTSTRTSIVKRYLLCSKPRRPSNQDWRDTQSFGLCPTKPKRGPCRCAFTAVIDILNRVVGDQWVNLIDNQLCELLTSVLRQSRQAGPPRLCVTVRPHASCAKCNGGHARCLVC